LFAAPQGLDSFAFTSPNRLALALFLDSFATSLILKAGSAQREFAVKIRPLTFDDIGAMSRLRDVAGWNQTEQDLRRLLKLEPEGCFAACLDGQVVGTTTTTTYGTDLAWIGMVLVDPDYRRRGIATALTERALAYLRSRGVRTIKLDATPAGRPVYERLGFEPDGRLERWAGEARGEVVDTLTADWQDVAPMDRLVFGADRGNLMRTTLADSAKPLFLRLGEKSNVAGYAVGRPGVRAGYIGPVVADSIETVRALLPPVFAGFQGQPIYVDIDAEFPGAIELMREFGFTPQRELLRMRFGPAIRLARSPRVFAIAGPEVG
jgi:GNAT superfamily N-acetyltransferase